MFDHEIAVHIPVAVGNRMMTTDCDCVSALDQVRIITQAEVHVCLVLFNMPLLLLHRLMEV